VPFFFWGFVEADARLRRWHLQPLLVAALLISPLVGDGYAKFDWPDFQRLRTLPVVEARLRQHPGPICAQSILFPQLPYDLDLHPLLPGCADRPGALLLVNPKLSSYPFKAGEIEQLAATPGAESLGAGFFVLKPVQPGR
jgi:hypothetical protein